MSDYDADAFDAYEAAGWETVASTFDQYWSDMSSLAVDALLDAAEVGAGMRVLDVGTGAGGAAGRAAERGADATGVDVAEAMVKIASRHHPDASFLQASASDLPFDDAAFDAVVGNIVVPHLGEPDRAVREMARVLVAGGRVALSTWDDPARSALFEVILGAVHDAEVPPPSGIPAGPSFFQFSDDALFASLLRGAGFDDVEVERIEFAVPIASSSRLATALMEGTVRIGALLRAADDAKQERLGAALDERLERWRRGDGYLVPAVMAIASGAKGA
jgi:SAM-dependent methyltransferase